MNKFLQQLDITFRRDPTNFRPRINKVRRKQIDCDGELTLVDEFRQRCGAKVFGQLFLYG